jgi:hypothetical protein
MASASEASHAGEKSRETVRTKGYFRPLDGARFASMFRASPENVVVGLWAFLPPRAISDPGLSGQQRPMTHNDGAIA